MWPRPGLLEKREFNQEMKLSGIEYQMNNNREMCGLRFHFHNGMSSRKFETTVKSTNAWQLVPIDIDDEIATIEVGLAKGKTKRNFIRAFRLRNIYGKTL